MISQRLRGVREDGEAIEEAGFMPKLQQAFAEVGVSIQDENGELRSTFDILNDLSKVWDSLNSKQKQYLGEKAAGNRQVKTLNAIMQNWETVLDTIEKANEATGEAAEGNEKFLDSIEGRITQFQSAFQDLARTTINSELIKSLVGIGTWVLEFTKSLGGLSPVLSTILGLVLAFKGAKIADGLQGIKKDIKELFSLLKGAKGIFGTISALPGAIGGILTAIGVIVSAVNLVNNLDQQRKLGIEQKATDARNKYEQETQKLSDLNKELETTNGLIDRLNSKTSLTIVEKDELERLKARNTELLRQIRLQQLLADEAKKEAREAARENILTNLRPSNDATFDAWYVEPYKTTAIKMEESIARSYKLMDSGLSDALLQQEDEHYKELEKEFAEQRSALTKERNDLADALKGLERVNNPTSETDKFINEMFDRIQAIDDLLLDADEQSMASESRLIFDKYKDEAEKIKGIIKDSGEFTAEDLGKPQFEEMLKEFQKYGWSVDDLVAHINEKFGQILEGENLHSFAELIEFAKSTPAYTELNKAISEQDKAGIMSASTWGSLIDADASIIDYLTLTANGYKITTDALYDYIEAQNKEQRENAVNSLIQKQAALEKLKKEYKGLTDEASKNANLNDQYNITKEIEGYSAIIREIDGMTDALARYQAARNSANEDAEFNVGQQAYKDISENLKIGKVGTDDFQTAIDFVLGEDWRDRLDEFGGDVEKAYAEAEKIGKRYFGQEDERTGMANFAKDLAKAGLADYNTKTGAFKLHDNVQSIEEVAKAVGVSEEAVRSLFGLMNTYGAKIEFPELVPESEVENAKALYDKREDFVKQNEELEASKENLIPGSEEYQAVEKQIEANNAVISEADEQIANLGKETEMTVEEAQKKIAELESIIASGIEVPVFITGQYNELATFLNNLGYEYKLFEIQVPVESNAEETQQEVELLVENLQNVDGTTYQADFTTNTQEGQQNVELLEENLQVFDGSVFKADATVDTQEAERNIETVSEDLQNVSEGPYLPLLKVEVDKSESEPLNNELNEMAQYPYLPLVKVEVDKTQVEALKDDLSKPINVKVNAIGNSVQEAPSAEPTSQSTTGGRNLPNVPTTEPLSAEVDVQPVVSEKSLQAFEDSAEATVEDFVKIFEQNGTDVNLGVLDTLSKGVEQLSSMADESESTQAKVEDVETAYSELTSAVEAFNNTDMNDMESYEKASNAILTASRQFIAAYNTLKNEINKQQEVKVNADVTRAVAAIDALSKRTVTVTVYGQTLGFATGTKHAPAGPSLVDEKGAELIEHTKQGTFELGTNNGPRFTNLEKGDVVHTAKETKGILKRLASIGVGFKNGLNQAKSILTGGAFALGANTIKLKDTAGSATKKKTLYEQLTSTISSAINKVVTGVKQTNNDFKVPTGGSSSGKSSSSSKSSGGGGGGSSSSTSFVDKLFDWAEIRLQRLEQATNEWIARASEALGYIAKNRELEGAIASVEEQIKNTTAAYDLYLAEADTVAKKIGLSQDIVDKIQKGDIQISEYSKEIQEKIKNYQIWFDKAQSVKEALVDLREQERQLATQKLDNVLQFYNNRINRLDNIVNQRESELALAAAQGRELQSSEYDAAIDATTRKLETLVEQENALREELISLTNRGLIQENSDDWFEYQSKLDDVTKAITDTKTAIIDLADAANTVALTKLGYQLDSLTNSANKISDMMSLHTAQGIAETAKAYEDLIMNGMRQIRNLEEQNEKYREQQVGLDELSEKYQDLENQIQQNVSTIDRMKVSQEEWNDAVLDLKIQELQDYKNELAKANDEYDRQKQLQEAIQNLEKARSQRTNRVYVEGIGFQYQGDADAIKDAQDNLDKIITNQITSRLDTLIDALNDAKNDTNVYDANGILLGTQYQLPQIGALSELLTNYQDTNRMSQIASLRDGIYNTIVGDGNGSGSMNLSIGDINISEVEDGNELAQLIIDQFPNALLQALYKK